MPRLPHSLLLRAHATNPLLPILLQTCRDLPSARNELRWLREHALELAQKRASEHAPEHVPVHCHARICRSRCPRPQSRTSTRTGWRALLRRMCEDRGRAKPLQYLLGTQPFGEVEILCRAGVLVPRPETESYTTHLAHLILSHRRQQQQQQQQSTWPRPPPQSPGSEPPDPALTAAESPQLLRILDLCTGTGCIPLLLHSLLSPHFPDLQILGIDISARAIALARRNLAHNIAKQTLLPVANSQIRFLRGDVLRAGPASVDGAGGRERDAPNNGQRWRNAGDREGERGSEGEGVDYLSKEWHIVTCNPPYISPRAFNTCTARSVRSFEPKLALVPPSIARLYAESDDAVKHANFSSVTSTSHIPPLQGQGESGRGDGDDGGDAFYPSILSIAKQVKARVLVMEVGDMAQAERVKALASTETDKGEGWAKVAIWRDWIDQRHPDAGAGKEEGSGRVQDVDVRVTLCLRHVLREVHERSLAPRRLGLLAPASSTESETHRHNLQRTSQSPYVLVAKYLPSVRITLTQLTTPGQGEGVMGEEL